MLVEDAAYPGFVVDEGADVLRVELGAGLGGEMVQSVLYRPGVLVGATSREGIENIGHADNFLP